MSFSFRIWSYALAAYGLLSLPVMFYHPMLSLIAFVIGFFLSVPAWLFMLFSLLMIKFLFPNSGMYVVNILLGIAITLVALIYIFFIHGRDWDHVRAAITFPSIAMAAIVTSLLMNARRIARYMNSNLSTRSSSK